MTDITMTYLTGLLITLPIIGILLNLISTNTRIGAQRSSVAVSTGFILSLALLGYNVVSKKSFYFLGFNTDSLGLLMTTLIFLVSAVVHQFSIRFMAGDRTYTTYFYKLSLLTSSASIMALTDQTYVFFAAWCLNNGLLISLMIHKKTWAAAAASGKLAFKTLFLGAILLLIGLVLMYVETGSFSISRNIQHPQHSSSILIALVFCMFAAMTQSAIWPFHRWLTSSLNSPTPVSAIMHAGLVNGGGFLLVRFAPLVAEHTLLLNLIFLLGVISAMFGTLWKLVQSDIKRMLACSTMGQMGFMMIQCGLGLFPAAIAHLFWHGLFKSFLFLSAGSAVHNIKMDVKHRRNSLSIFVIACTHGLLGAYCFAWFSNKSFFSMNTSAFLVGFAFIASTQMAHAMLQTRPSLLKSILSVTAAVFAGGVYGCSILLIESILPSLATHTHSINALHLFSFVGFIIMWLVLNLECMQFTQKTALWKRFYMGLLNASQPHPKTTTSVRKSYQF